MTDDFLATLLGDQSRARVLRVFVLGQSQVFTVAQAAKRAGVKTLVAQREMKTLEKIGVLKKGKFSIQVGKTKRTVTGKQREQAWTFDTGFRYALALSRFVHETAPVQHKAIMSALKGSGRISVVILSGSFLGDSSRPADLMIVADNLNEKRLETAIKGFEPALGHEIRYATFSTPEFRYRLTIQDRLIRDIVEYPHLVLLDRLRLL